MKKHFTKQRLSPFEFKLVKGSCLGFMNQTTVAAATFPAELMEAAWYRAMTPEQVDSIILLLKNNQERLGKDAFGDDQNRMIWQKFLAFMDVNCHYFVELTNGDQVKVFEANDRIYQYDIYQKEPRREVYLRKEFINKKL